MKPNWILTLILVTWSTLVENWEETCPEKCTCTFYQNKKVAKCKNAGFQTIPSVLSNSIHVLNLNNNKLTRLQSHAFMSVNLLNLHRIYLSHNIISSVDKDAFVGLGIVTDLDLSNNMISWIHNETFSGMKRLRKLILNGNTLRRLEAYQFPYLKSLQHLEISNCNISYVNNFAFANLPNLDSISLNINKLTILLPQLFLPSKNLVFVQLTNNEWICDCKLRKLVSWFQKKRLGEAELSCNSPQAVAGKLWKNLDYNDLACPPRIYLPKVAEFILVGTSATLACGASGEPSPTIHWNLGHLVLSNRTRTKSKETFMDVTIHEDFVNGVHWTNLTINYTSNITENYNPSLMFTCVVENPAGLIERNASLYLTTDSEVMSVSSDPSHLYFIIAVVSVTILILVLLALLVYCCARRVRKNEKPQLERQLMERNNILIVNPMENSPRKVDQYEKLPQGEVELTDLSHGSHRNFEEMNYPEERVGRVRSPLTVLEEEEFDHSSQKLLDLSGTTTTTLEMPQYPDLLDTVRFPRAVSPTQLSYHSLANTVSSPSEWRYSFVYPPDSVRKVTTPQNLPRPGYITLPRRPRSSSVSSPTGLLNLPKQVIKLDPIYDTLGPRTTADGTSRTDLTRPLSRNAIDQFLSHMATLPENYVPILEEPQHFSTLPRSTQSIAPDKKMTICASRKQSPNDVQLSAAHVNLNNLPNGTDNRVASPDLNTYVDLSPTKKKVPPKPPPKPLNKRLSVTSSISDAGSKMSDRDFQEEGPDGTEV